MRILAMLLVCLAAVACSATLLTPDDMELYCHSRVFKPLILPKEIAEKHPRITKQLHKAMQRWELSAPVDFKIFEGQMGPRGSISVVFNPAVNPFIMMMPGILGLYNADAHYLFFNEEMEHNEKEFSDDSIYKTCLHELGHVLGLPHIVGKLDEKGNPSFDFAGSFDIVLPTDEEARKCIMYPIASDKDQTDLSPVEILWVRHALMHDLNLTTFLGLCMYGKENGVGLQQDQAVIEGVSLEGD
jgi:hypothetical protein